ncbi:DUF411 domain-containing protein [Paraglaciecola polaris]|uniref:Metal-binding protein n=1 Tax=Paraglaciecola polaris LMG 21857 TaxID=1129793 RepID=K6ZPV3_9ALTE|nr:DUF411 domain-containing protein [Paraglaciecola polaris]GAC32292.1 hypothetical protein GPLA_1378 [Paraglaciecola polaris LMG 21857]
MHSQHIILLLTLALPILAGCSEPVPAPLEQTTQRIPDSAQSEQSVSLRVYKTPSCGCCKKWISHLEDQGISTSAVNLPDLEEVKFNFDIAPRYRSCHSAVSENGYVFEGHVPSKFIKQFLNDVPARAIGLAVPGMPAGSPGMEMGDRFMPYQVLLLQRDGSSRVYAEVSSYEEQF